ncbi:hypothetical protein GCM10025792_50810 [Pseudonocardia tropica]
MGTRASGYPRRMSDDENDTGRASPPIDPERALDELEERVLGQRIDAGDTEADRAESADTTSEGAAEAEPVGGAGEPDDAGTGVDAPTD